MPRKRKKNNMKEISAVKKIEDTKLKVKLNNDAMMMISIGNCQNQGKRPRQEDSFGYSNIIDESVVEEKGFLSILADGMGGLANGKAVSEYVVRKTNMLFESFFSPLGDDISEQLQNIIFTVNKEICAQYVQNGTSSAGATVLILYIYKNYAYWACVGDSRIYCLRNNNLFPLNEDHDYQNLLYRAYIDGKISLEAAENDSQKEKLVSFVGKADLNNIDLCRNGIKVKPNDVFVLCSDGIYNALSNAQMKDILKNYNAQAASEKIVEAVLEADIPGQDNMTVMVVKCSKKG